MTLNRKGAKAQRKARKGKREDILVGDAGCLLETVPGTIDKNVLALLRVSFAPSRLCG
ncbi:MAG TPA: hypothetical protein VEW72_05725 [Burkholderiales bacterium]|nr:hypothetical protein [Burkholderiales bacterium]